MRELVPLVVGLVAAALAMGVMLLNVWSLIHGGPEARDSWFWSAPMFYLVPILVGFFAGWVVYRWMGVDWRGTPPTQQ